MSYKKYGNLPKEEKQVVDDICIHINSKQDRDRVISKMQNQQTTHICIIDNYTEWCGPCKMVAPKYVKLAKKYTNTDPRRPTVIFCKEDAEKAIPGQPQVRGVPCFHFYVNGMLVQELTVTGADIGKVEQNLQQIFNRLNG